MNELCSPIPHRINRLHYGPGEGLFGMARAHNKDLIEILDGKHFDWSYEDHVIDRLYLWSPKGDNATSHA